MVFFILAGIVAIVHAVTLNVKFIRQHPEIDRENFSEFIPDNLRRETNIIFYTGSILIIFGVVNMF